MAETTLARRLLDLEGDSRKASLKATHALHKTYLDAWTTLLDAYEGSGGFLDGSYLWRYRREDTSPFNERQQQARYHNFAKTIVGIYVRHVLGKHLTRTTTNPELEAWWEDVDGAGTPIHDFMKRALKLGLALGHEGILVDKTPDLPTGPAKADERARPFLTLYHPPSILDWRLDRNELVGLKLAESARQPDILTPLSDSDEPEQYLLFDRAEWARFTPDAELITTELAAEGLHDLGLIPFVVLRPEPSTVHPFIGLPLLGDAKVYKALYNRCSEEDEVLRAQGFSLFVIQANSPDDVERIKQQFGGEVGTTRAVVTSGTATFETPDQAVPEAIRKNISWLIQEIYRAAHVRFDRESLDAESAEAIRLQHSELNEMLVGTAQECHRVEQALARMFFAWTTATPEQAEAAYQKAEVTISYPTEFFTSDMLADLEALAQALSIDFGETFKKAQKKRMARRYDPSMDVKTLDEIDAEIDAQQAEAESSVVAIGEQLRSNAAQRMAALMGDREQRAAMAEAVA